MGLKYRDKQGEWTIDFRYNKNNHALCWGWQIRLSTLDRNCDPSLYQMAEIKIPELKNCDPSERHLRAGISWEWAPRASLLSDSRMYCFFWNFPDGGVLSGRALFHEVLEGERSETELVPLNDLKVKVQFWKVAQANKPVEMSSSEAANDGNDWRYVDISFDKFKLGLGLQIFHKGWQIDSLVLVLKLNEHQVVVRFAQIAY